MPVELSLAARLLSAASHLAVNLVPEMPLKLLAGQHQSAERLALPPSCQQLLDIARQKLRIRKGEGQRERPSPRTGGDPRYPASRRHTGARAKTDVSADHVAQLPVDLDVAVLRGSAGHPAE